MADQENTVVQLFQQISTQIESVKEELTDIKLSMKDASNDLSKIDSRVKVLELKSEPAIKEQLVNKMLNGVVSSVSACFGISLFFALSSVLGVNVLTIIKGILSQLV